MDIQYDQHFLTDESVLSAIAESCDIAPDDVVLEVGAGAGQLTEHLLKQSPLQLIALEKDEEFRTSLNELDQQHEEFSYRITNALDELDQIRCNVVVGNIPYSITEPLYKKLLEVEVSRAVLTHGMHFLKIMESPDHKWHHFIHAFYDVQPLFKISGDQFTPPAKTESIVVKLTLREDTSISIKDRFLQNLYRKKDRNTRNALSFALVDTFKLGKHGAREKVDAIGLSEEVLQKKFENISSKDCQTIFRHLL